MTNSFNGNKNADLPPKWALSTKSETLIKPDITHKKEVALYSLSLLKMLSLIAVDFLQFIKDVL